MKDILTAPFVQEMMQTTANMYRLGWDERNGGNISYMLDEKEVGEYLDLTKVIRTIPTGFDAKPLIGKIFIVTGTGKYFKNVQFDPENNLGIIRITEDGTTVSVRPSGTEPKIKFYFGVKAPLASVADFDEVQAELDAKIEGIKRDLKLE